MLESSHYIRRIKGVVKRELPASAGFRDCPDLSSPFTVTLGETAEFSKHNNDGMVAESRPDSQDRSAHEKKTLFPSVMSVQLFECVTR